jgi:hypothetical protein
MTLRHSLLCLLGLGSLMLVSGACAASPLPGGRPLRDRAAGYELTVLVDGVPAPTFAHDGETYMLGQLGARYTLRVSNHSGRRIEAVVSVDGRDAIDGRPADFRGKRGYLVPAWGSVDIDGWRISQAEAAAFRFSSVPDSYAARTGSAREVGVIGVAVFPERAPAYTFRPSRPVAPPYREPYGRYQSDGHESYGYDDARPDRGSGAPKSAETEKAPAAPAAGEAFADDGRARSDAQPNARRSRPGLGTEYGEAVSSPIYEVEFVRANAGRPAVVLGMRYNDRAGLLALGIPVDRVPDDCTWDDNDLRRTAEPFPVSDRRFAAPPTGWRRACGWR